jgi:hypothetical protein
MYFTMTNHVEDGKTFTRRSGKMTMSYKQAASHAIKKHGFVVDESNRVIAQAMSPDMPKYIGTQGSINLRDIGSGEDCYAQA